MLKIEKKEYEIEEKIQLTEKDTIICEVDMKITEEELNKIEDILFADAKNKTKDYFGATVEEKNKIEKEIEEKITEKNVEFAKICFKDTLDEYVEKAGQYKFDETIEMLRGYFYDFFMKKRMKPLNTVLTDLTKISNNFAKFR